MLSKRCLLIVFWYCVWFIACTGVQRKISIEDWQKPEMNYKQKASGTNWSSVSTCVPFNIMKELQWVKENDLNVNDSIFYFEVKIDLVKTDEVDSKLLGDLSFYVLESGTKYSPKWVQPLDLNGQVRTYLMAFDVRNTEFKSDSGRLCCKVNNGEASMELFDFNIIKADYWL